ncbi:MAG: STAS domain-containing protein [Flavobacteriaceae bacterium]
MALHIIEHNDGLEVSGNLTFDNMGFLKRTIEHKMSQNEFFTVSLDKLDSIDPQCAKTLERLFQKVVRENKALKIIGLENESIMPAMRATNTSYILCDDRV